MNKSYQVWYANGSSTMIWASNYDDLLQQAEENEPYMADIVLIENICWKH